METQTHPQIPTRETKTRRTRKDLRYLAAGLFLGHEGGDPKRNARIKSHGWIDGQGHFTDLGRDLKGVTNVLGSRGRFDRVLDTVGLAEYVDIIEKFGARESLAIFAGMLSVRAVVDDVLDFFDVDPDADDDAHPIAYFGFRNPSSGRVRDRVTIREDRYASPSVLRAIEREATDRGYVVQRHPDDRTRNGKSKHITTVLLD